jgi:putative membrane protein
VIIIFSLARRVSMKSYILAIAITMFLSALYAFQNIEDVTVRFLVFEWVFPQGVWEVLLFCAGAAIMWVFSIFSTLEIRSKYKKVIKSKDEIIAAAENEKKMILESLASRSRVSPPDPDVCDAGDMDETQSSGLAD